MEKKIIFTEREEEAIKTLATELKMPVENTQAVIEGALMIDAARIHKHGLSKRFIAGLKARCLGLDNYICSFTL